MNFYKTYFRKYCPAYNWINNGEHKVYCSTYCPHFVGISKNGMKPICGYIEEKIIKKILNMSE